MPVRLLKHPPPRKAAAESAQKKTQKNSTSGEVTSLAVTSVGGGLSANGCN